MTRSLLGCLGLLASVGLWSSPAVATVVSGQVTNGGGAGVANVDLDFIDRNTGTSIALVNDDTDILGFYAVSVPAGDYDIRFKPVSGVRLVGVELRGERVEGGSMTLNQQLDGGWFLSGRVVDDSAIPVANLDLDFNDLVDGGPIFIAHDSTGATGSFNVVVPSGLYSMELEPQVGTDLVARIVDNLQLSSDTSLGDLALQSGVHLSGPVEDTFAIPVSGASVETLDPVSGAEIFNIRNGTALTGLYDIVVAPGSYSLRVIPPGGLAVLPRLVAGVSLQANLSMPAIVLDSASVASGLVRDPASDPVDGVDLDFTPVLSGIKSFTPRDNTDKDGLYAVAVRPAVYDIGFNPPAGSGLAPAELKSVNLTASVALPPTQLQAGFTVSGIVRDGASSPLQDVDLDFLQPGSGAEIPSSSDETDAAGAFSTVVPAGTYDIEFNPADGSGVDRTVLINVTVAGNLNLGTISLGTASPSFPAGVSPLTGSAAGGTPVTITGTGFAPGVKVKIGGRSLSGINRVNASTIQGTTRAHRTGAVDVEVINPGAAPASLASAFTYTAPAIDPVLTVTRTGPLHTDVQLQWGSTGQPAYTVFRSSNPGVFGDAEVLDVVTATAVRDEGSAVSGGSNFFYLVH